MGTMEFQLVRGTPDRISEYREVFLHSKLYDAYFADGDSLDTWLSKGIRDGNLYAAVTPEGEAIGVMYMSEDGMAGLPYLHLLGVKREYRGRGVGTALVKIFIGVMEEKGYPNLFIMTSKFNVGAKRLYQSLGFQPKCLLPDLMRKGVAEWLFMRPSRRPPRLT